MLEATAPKLEPNLKDAMAYEAPPLLLERFAKRYSISESEAGEGFDEVKKYLLLCAKVEGNPFPPGGYVDDMWHEFILFSLDYEKFCETLGCYISHVPQAGGGRGDIVSKDYVSLLGNLRARFGEINPVWWERTVEIDGSRYPELISQIVDQNLLAQTVERLPEGWPRVTDAETQAAANEFRYANRLLTARQTHDWLQEAHLSSEEFEKILRRGIQTRKIKERVTRSRVRPYFEAYRESFDAIQLFRVTVRDEAMAYRLAGIARDVGLRAAAQSQLSNGSGAVRGVVLSKSVRDLPSALAAARLGDIYGPVSENSYYWVAEVLHRRPARLTADLRASIRNTIFHEWVAGTGRVKRR